MLHLTSIRYLYDLGPFWAFGHFSVQACVHVRVCESGRVNERADSVSWELI